jgi:hypothetical protein
MLAAVAVTTLEGSLCSDRGYKKGFNLVHVRLVW